MAKKDDGGPAFPPLYHPMAHPNCPPGMSLRDYFAAKAMHGELVSAGSFIGPAKALADAAKKAGQTTEQRIAFNAYELADAMLAEREK